MMKKLLVAALLAGSLGSVTVSTSAAEIIVRNAPPAPRAERTPPPRHGYLWTQGHWDWRNHHHVWVKGNWVRDRPGYDYHQPTWEQHGGNWQMARGNWTRNDHNGNGAQNHADNHQNDQHGNQH